MLLSRVDISNRARMKVTLVQSVQTEEKGFPFATPNSSFLSLHSSNRETQSSSLAVCLRPQLTPFFFHVNPRVRARVRFDQKQKMKQVRQRHRDCHVTSSAPTASASASTKDPLRFHKAAAAPLGLISLAQLSQRRFRIGNAIFSLISEEDGIIKERKWGTTLRQRDGRPGERTEGRTEGRTDWPTRRDPPMPHFPVNRRQAAHSPLALLIRSVVAGARRADGGRPQLRR